ncbi:MAG TPA: hypothetical protein VLA24_17940 [Pseudomonadales bacterium]|nr:hypothetical protein [Pseudomonadales bacterium]
MIYRVTIDTSSARREAQNLRKSIESELKSINTGKINVGGGTGVAGGIAGIGGATDEMSLFEKTVSSGAKRITSELKSIALGYIGIQAAIGAVNAVADLARLQTEASRAGKSFEILSGGADKAQLNIAAIQRASNNTVDSLTAMKIGTQAAALGLANTSAEFERLVAAAKLIVQVSPTINDIGDALSQLALFASNEASFARADQLGLSVSEVKDRISELRAENENLTGSQAKLESSIQLVNEKFGDLSSTVEAQASGIEKLTIAWTEFTIAVSGGSGIVQDFSSSFASGLNQITVMLAGTRAPVSILIGNLTELEKTTRAIEEADPFSRFIAHLNGTGLVASQEFAIVRDSLNSALSAVDEGIPGSGQILRDVLAIATAVDRWNTVSVDQLASLRALNTELNTLYVTGGKAEAAALSAEEAAVVAAAQRAKSILEQSEPIGGALQSRASKSVETVGLEAAVAALREQKALVDNAITELINSSVTDSDEIALRLAQIQEQAVSFFDAMEERSADFSFDEVPDAFANIFAGLNSADSDFIPFLEGLRDDSIRLFEEIAAAGGAVTEEQAIQLDFLSSAAAAASDEMSPLTSIVNELGGEFIATNGYAGDLIGQLYESQAALAAGQISAEQYAGRISAIGGALLAYITQMGGATSATYALIAAQSGLSGTPGFAAGFSFGGASSNAAKLQADARERERVRREAQAAARRAQSEAQAAARRAASEAERSAKRAGSELEKGARAAASELKSALQSVPGLFKRSSVTQEQLDAAAGGAPQNFADDYLRRLKDEIENGADWADVSIEEAKEALAKIGVTASENNRIAFEQFASAWDSSALFADKSNLSFINQEAVKLQLDLQEKSKQGQANIYELFGIAVDDAVEAVGAGLSSAGASGSMASGYTIPVKAELVPIPQAEFEPGGAFAPPVVTLTVRAVQGPLPQSAFMPTLGGVSPVVDVAAIQGQLNALTIEITPTIDTSSIDFTGPLATITEGLTPRITATVDSVGFTVQAFSDYESLKSSLTPHIDATIDSVSVGAQALTDLETIKSSLTPHVIASVDSLGITVGALASVDAVGASVAGLIKSSIASHISTTEWADGQIVAPIADGLVASINTQIRGSVDRFKREGGGVGDLVKAGIAQNINTTEWADGAMVAPIATGLITAINTQIRGNVEGFRREGQGVASIVMTGLAQSWGETDAGGNATNGLALGLLGALNSQLGATQNFFYAAGYTPATNLLDGFKGTFGTGTEGGTALIEPLLSSIGTGIRANQENFQQRGGTVARLMINGFTSQFSSEEFKNTLVAAGETMGAYLEIGILSRIRGGALVEAIGAQVLADITATVEEPAP